MATFLIRIRGASGRTKVEAASMDVVSRATPSIFRLLDDSGNAIAAFPADVVSGIVRRESPNSRSASASKASGRK